MKITSLLIVASLCAACTSTGGKNNAAAPENFRPIAAGDVLYAWSGGLDALLVDPKDAGVREALRRIGARMVELPTEFDDPAIPGEELALASSLLLGPMSLSVGVPLEEDPESFPVRAQLDFRGATPEEARARADALTKALAKAEMPSLGLDEATGLSLLDFGPIQALHGVAKGGRADTLVVAVNGLDFTPRDLGTLDLPADAVPAMAFRLDMESLGEMVGMFGGPEASGALDAFGTGNFVVQGAIGHSPNRCHAAIRNIGWVPIARANGTLATGSIERSALELIPADATVAIIARSDLGSIAGMFETAAEIGDEALGGLDPLALVREATGIDFERDLLDHLGETYGVYASDATGGGGLYSWVGFVSVRDEAALRDALGRLEGRLEDLAADEGLPGFTMRHSQHDGADITTMAVSGWPIPVEPSWAIRDGWFFASVSAQGVRAALDSARGRNGSLVDEDRFEDEVSGSLDDLVSLAFIDIARFARDGYPAAAMFGAALSNGVSSAGEPDRAPVGIVPGFVEFLRGARATVALGRLEGDDLVVRSSGDRSILVQSAGMIGALGPFVGLVAGLAIAGAQEDEDVPVMDEVEMFEDAEMPIEIEIEMIDEVPVPELVPPPDESEPIVPNEDPK